MEGWKNNQKTKSPTDEALENIFCKSVERWDRYWLHSIWQSIFDYVTCKFTFVVWHKLRGIVTGGEDYYPDYQKTLRWLERWSQIGKC